MSEIKVGDLVRIAMSSLDDRTTTWFARDAEKKVPFFLSSLVSFLSLEPKLVFDNLAKYCPIKWPRAIVRNDADNP